jgi:hypothetical protein
VGSIKPSQKYSFFVFMNQGWNSFDYDFGAPPKFIRASPVGILAVELADTDLCRNANAPVICSPPLDPGPGKSSSMEFDINYQPTKPLNLSLSVQQSKLRRNDTGVLAFQDNIYSFHGTYQFSRFVFARARVDYDTLSSNARGQFLFGYTPNPMTSPTTAPAPSPTS